jgi:ribosomal 50S subunit-recycling heat shock protein
VIVKPFFLGYNYFVRLDSFLKTSKLIKRRARAREMCDSGWVLVNGHEAKPAKEVKQGDVITLKFSSRIIDLEVIGGLAEPSKKLLPEELYRVKSEMQLPKEKDRWSEHL